MSRLNILGTVKYVDTMTRVEGARVKILDLDPLQHDDVILNVATNSDGNFSGLSKDPIDHPLDLPNLWFKVSKPGYPPHSGPFIRFPNGHSADIVTPWLPPADVGVIVNGKECRTPDAVFSEIVDVVQKGKDLTIDVPGLEGEKLLPLRNPREIVSGGRLSAFVPVGLSPIFYILLAIAGIILASGASLLLVAVGVSLILAIVYGYNNIHVDQTTDANGKNHTVFNINKP